MNISIRVLALLALVGASLTGCSAPTVVTLQDGTQYLTEDAPRTRTADGFYEFTDIAGKRVRVRADEVATVKPGD
ncbi:YgdI/YgdR family lipoprotein [Pseudomonas syringae]|nr:YgdI/YgdR family lipoprotein [Pseudomonas syringae]